MYDIQVLFTIVRRPGRNYDFLVGKSTIFFFLEGGSFFVFTPLG